MPLPSRSAECLGPTDIDVYARGAAEPQQRQRVLAHIATCLRCATQVRAAQASAWDTFDIGPSSNSANPLDTGAAVPRPAAEPPSKGSSVTADTLTFGSQASPPVAMGPGDVLKPGDDILGYRLQALLGRGGMGLTWRAQRPFEAEPVALKVLPEQLSAHQIEMERVKYVFKLIKTLRHPAIAMVYQLCEHPRHGPILIMELVDGVTLRTLQNQRLDQGGIFTMREAMEILHPVADALDYAHANRVVHRDVKPSNLMLRPDCTGVKLIDFGLGDEIRQTIVHVSLVETPVAGTAPYMAPEQWRGHAPSPATDQYALGCLAYELLTGHPPFVGGDVNILRSCHLGEPIPAAVEIPPAAFDIFWRDASAGPAALAKTRDQRFANCRAFVAALQAAV